MPELNHEDLTVSLSKLHFDPVNPRGEPELDEEKVRELFGLLEETYALAAHIAEHGQNPLDRIGIVVHPNLPGHYVAREGNRRLCAMQLLRDPERAPAKTRKKFQALASSLAAPLDEVRAVLFHKKEKARVWMSVKHEGPQGGLGTVQWGPSEKARFNREGETGSARSKNPNLQAEALLTYAVDAGIVTAEERKLIALTTITRYLPNVRAALALMNSEDCTTNARVAEFNAALQRFLRDAIDSKGSGGRSTVHSRSTAAQRIEYAEKLRQEGAAPKNRDCTPYDPSQQLPVSEAESPEEKRLVKPRGATHPEKRKQLIPNSFVVSLKDDVLLRLVSEGKSLNPDLARFSCNYLNRVILERIIYLFARKNGIGTQGVYAEDVQRVIKHLKTSATPLPKGITNVLTKTADKKYSYSYEQMSNPVHGGSVPSGADNRVNWETLQPVLLHLLSLIQK